MFGKALKLLLAAGAMAMSTGVCAAAAVAHPMQVDATALSTTQFKLGLLGTGGGPVGTFDGATVQSLDLADGQYQFSPGSGMTMSCAPTVTAAGTWDYPATCDEYVSGRGTARLTLDGYAVTVDASPLSTPVVFANAFGPSGGPISAPRTLRLVPTDNPYAVQPGSGQVSSCSFGVGDHGLITYPDALQGCLAGRGTSTVTFAGVPIDVDARELSTTGFTIPPALVLGTTLQSSTAVEHYRLLPLAVGANGFRPGVFSPLAWTVDLAGHVDYSHDDDGWVDGRGTGTLVVHGYPIEVDASALGTGTFSITPAFGLPALDRGIVASLRLVPGGYHFAAGSSPSFDWRLPRTGGVDYDDSVGPCIFGRATNRLTVGCRHLMIADASVIEGNAGTTLATFTLSLSGPTPVSVNVDWATLDGTAKAPSDYQASSGVVTIPAGQTSATITVPVNGDAIDEGDETFGVMLSGARGADIDDALAVGTILDDDQPAPPSLDCSAVSAGPDLLWPPNHKLRQVSLTGLDSSVALAITAVTQDEALNGLGDGDTAPDATRGATPAGVWLRAERAGSGDGRVYRISFSGSDPLGRTCRGSVTVEVPHDGAAHATAVDSGQTVNSFGA